MEYSVCIIAAFLIVRLDWLYHCTMQRYPDEEIPEFKPVMSQLYDECLLLSRKLLEMMGYALKLKVRVSFIIVFSICNNGRFL